MTNKRFRIVAKAAALWRSLPNDVQSHLLYAGPDGFADEGEVIGFINSLAEELARENDNGFDSCL